jgi:HD-like signal output (HDOD) protein
VEHDLLGASHPAVGAYLLALWGLPTDLVEAVRRHHMPIASFPEAIDPAAIVVISNHLAHDQDHGAVRTPPAHDARWPEWRRIADAVRSRT